MTTLTVKEFTTKEIGLNPGDCFKSPFGLCKVIDSETYISLTAQSCATERMLKYLKDSDYISPATSQEFYEAAMNTLQSLESQMSLIQQNL